MIGAIAGDVIGSAYEHNRIKTTEFKLFTESSRFTDDTVLTIAVADCILSDRDYAFNLKEYGRRYPGAGYGAFFRRWLRTESLRPYESYGNGSAMRVSPIAFAYGFLDEVLEESRKSAEVTHDHPEGIKGAQAAASAIFLLKQGESKESVKRYVENNFNYDLGRKLDDIRPEYSFDSSCQGTVPEAMIAFFESHDYEDSVRNAVSLGGDADTLACIAGAMAQAHYKEIPDHIIENTRRRLPPEFLIILDKFTEKYSLHLDHTPNS